jgi:hypothetical protein
MRDSEIEQWVINEIRLMTGSRLRELCVFSLNGVVNLQGTVQSRADKLAAREAAERGKGVVGVINQLNMRRRNLARRRPRAKNQVVRASGRMHFPNHTPASSHVAN